MRGEKKKIKSRHTGDESKDQMEEGVVEKHYGILILRDKNERNQEGIDAEKKE